MRSCAHCLCALLILAPSFALANHGPGASGGGSSTVSGETLKPGSFELSLREDYSQFQHFNQSQAAHRATSFQSTLSESITESAIS